jgi:hypothetical protein
MKFTESLTVKDVETVAKGRISRAESKNTNYATIAMVLAMGIGLLVLRTNQMAGVALFIVGAAVFFWYTSVLSKKQNAAKQKAVAEWHKEVQEQREHEALVAVQR